MIILDGKKLRGEIVEMVKEKSAILKPSIAVILISENPASLIYVRNKKRVCEKAGIKYNQLNFPESITHEELLVEVEKLNNDSSVNGFILQLPVPDHINLPKINKAIDPKKDIDGFTAYNIGKTFLDTKFEDLPPATPLGIITLLNHYNIEIEGKEVVVVGRSNIAGKPISAMMLNRNATVTTCHTYTKNLIEHTRRADILIVAVGKRNLITEDMVKDDVVVVDVGINHDENGNLCGDVDFDGVSRKASYITPVPGGIGPMTIAGLLLNTIRATERQAGNL